MTLIDSQNLQHSPPVVVHSLHYALRRSLVRLAASTDLRMSERTKEAIEQHKATLEFLVDEVERLEQELEIARVAVKRLQTFITNNYSA